MSQLKYHPDSPYFSQSGYLGSLTSEQSQLLKETEDWFIAEEIELNDLCLNALSLQLVLLRYIRANKFDLKKTKDHIRKNVQWRADNNVKELINLTPSEILGIDVMEVQGLAPHWQSGFDKNGRPIVYKHYNSSFDATKIKNLSSMEALTRYHLWEMEACMRLCYEQSLQTGYIVETISAVVDVGGMQMWQLSFDLLALIQNLAEVDQVQLATCRTILKRFSFFHSFVSAGSISRNIGAHHRCQHELLVSVCLATDQTVDRSGECREDPHLQSRQRVGTGGGRGSRQRTRVFVLRGQRGRSRGKHASVCPSSGR